MAIKKITIDERIKASVGSDPQTHTSVADYKGTLVVCDSEGIKLFNGSNLQLIYSVTNITSSVVVVGDDLYYGTISSSQYALFKYNFITGASTNVVSMAGGKINNVIYKDGKIYFFFIKKDSRWKSLYYRTYDINTGSKSSNNRIDTTPGMGESQIWFDGDHYLYMSYASDGAVRKFDLNTNSLTADSYAFNEKVVGAGIYIHDNIVNKTFGSDLFDANISYPTVREFNANMQTVNTETVPGLTRADFLGYKYVGFWDGAYCIATSKGLVKITYITYSLTYSFYDSTGQTLLYSVDDKYPITSLLFSKNDDGVSFIFNTLDGTVTGAFAVKAPEGKSISGISLKAGSRAGFLFGTLYNVSIYDNCNFYISLITDRPPATTFNINLYQNSAEVNRVDKTDYITAVGTLSGALREECSIVSPSITFKQESVPTFNYVYIEKFGRYYFVTGITSVAKDLWRMSLSCDVLMTWKDNIRALTAIIARQENSYNPLLLDSNLPAQANQNITVAEFQGSGFTTSETINYPFVLTVVGA